MCKCCVILHLAFPEAESIHSMAVGCIQVDLDLTLILAV